MSSDSVIIPDTCIFYKVLLREEGYNEPLDIIKQSQNNILLNEVNDEFRNSLMAKFCQILVVTVESPESGRILEKIHMSFSRLPASSEIVKDLYDLALAVAKTHSGFDRYLTTTDFWRYMTSLIVNYEGFCRGNKFKEMKGGFQEWRERLREKVGEDMSEALGNDLTILAEAWCVIDSHLKGKSVTIVTSDRLWPIIEGIIGEFASLKNCDC